MAWLWGSIQEKGTQCSVFKEGTQEIHGLDSNTFVKLLKIYGMHENTVYQNIWLDQEHNTLQEDLEYLTLKNLTAWHSFEAYMYKNTTE